MIIIPIPILVNPYYKKKDVEGILTKFWKIKGYILLFVSLVAFVTHFAVLNSLDDLNRSFEIQVSLWDTILKFCFYVVNFFVVIYGFYFAFTKPDLQKIESFLNKYKDDEMVDIREIKMYRFEWMIIFMLVIIDVGLLFYNLVSPIYLAINLVEGF